MVNVGKYTIHGSYGNVKFCLRDSLSNPKFALVGASVTQLLPSSMGFFDDLRVVSCRGPAVSGFFFRKSRGNDVTIHGKTLGGQTKVTCINKTIDVTPLLIHQIR